MTFDTTVPESLIGEQLWFADIISRRLLHDDTIQKTAPSGSLIEDEASLHIAPSPTLEPWQRVEIYNQQYWWRILKMLQEIFPGVVRLFSCEGFNALLAIPYMEKYPSQHWSIDHIGDRFPQWIDEEYIVDDKQLVLDMSRVDLAFSDAWVEQTMQPLDISTLPGEGNISELLHHRLYLQPWVYLFELEYDLFSFRDKLLSEEPDHWLDEDFPELSQDKERYCFMIYRNGKDDVVWDGISQAEYQVLQRFKEGSTIEEACEWLEKQDRSLCDAAAAHIHFWFQEWTIRNWLTLEKVQ